MSKLCTCILYFDTLSIIYLKFLLFVSFFFHNLHIYKIKIFNQHRRLVSSFKSSEKKIEIFPTIFISILSQQKNIIMQISNTRINESITK